MNDTTHPPSWLDLNEDEKVVQQDRPSIIPYLFQCVVGIVVALFGLLMLAGMNLLGFPGPFPRGLTGGLLVLLGVLNLGAQLLDWYSSEYVVTTDEIYEKKGIISGRFAVYPLTYSSVQIDDIANTSVEKGYFGQFFNYGDVSVVPSSGTYLFLNDVWDPDHFTETIRKAADGYSDAD
ncbi:PH domain-containing protein [Halorhabdus rudnickae]|uniref:PH domain-containing protein n=1 Tax=Halorhabdus rudnickae TaxID=1775544 RepID=UPI001083EEB7|nr:PH domain-containing protein [Halorhabdus rudnickae]